jgi:hypothetical protein
VSNPATFERTQELPLSRPRPSRHRQAAGGWRPAGPIWLVGLVALAWALPVGTHALGIDLLLPPAVLVGTASLLRAGRSLLDRLMLALFLLLGAACAAGLALSVWPWGLAPVPVAGLALTALVALAAITGRRPSLPRPTVADGATVAGAAAVAVYLALPYLRANLTGRIGLAMAGEDLARHLTVFDGIHQVGGYLFLHPDAAHRYVYSGMVRYPQGFHFVSALLDGFLPHHDGSAVTAFDHLIGFHIAGYGVLTLSVVWAARWIGGRSLGTAWRWLPVAVLLPALCVRGELTADFVDGYPSEILGLALVAALVAVLARPVAAARTQLLLVGCLLVALGFTYYLFLPGMGLAALVWLVMRRRWLPRPAFVAPCAAVAGALALLPLCLGVLGGGQTESLKAASGAHNSRAALVALTLVIAAGVVSPAGRRSAVWRRYRWAVLALLGYVLLLGGYQKLVTGHTGYYFEKSLHAAQVVLLLGVGSLTALLPAPAPYRGRRGRTRLALALPSVLLAASVGMGLGLVRSDTPYRPMWGVGNWGDAWVSDQLAQKRLGALTAEVVERYAQRPPAVTMLLSDDAYTNYAVSLFSAALTRNAGTPISRAFYTGRLPAASDGSVRTMILAPRVPVTAVVTSPRLVPVVLELQRRYPQQGIQLIDLSRRPAPPG